MSGLVLNSVSKRFHGQAAPALDGVDLSVPPGEFVSLVGPSGCGKSTLLRIVAGLISQDAGQISIDGSNVDAVSPKHRDVAMVFQTYALYPHMTAFDNIAVPLRMRQLSIWERLPLARSLAPGRNRKIESIRREVLGVAELLSIEALLGRKPAQLSGGQRQRVAIGRAIVRQPRIFLMDEPLSNLDAALRVQMRIELINLHRKLGSTFLFVTHDQAEAMTLSQRIAVMFEGRIFQIDTPEQIYNRPSHIRVARFVGSPCINLLSGRITIDGRVEVGPVMLRVRVPAASPGTEVTVGLRPEAFTLVAPGKMGFGATVTHVENLGSEVLVHVATDHAERLTVRVSPHGQAIPDVGARVTAAPVSSLCSIFDSNGERLEAVHSFLEGRAYA